MYKLFQLKTPRQLAKFVVVGFTNTILDFTMYFVLTRLSQFFFFHKVTTKAISYTAGVINSYILNRSWTFRSSKSILKSAGKFLVISLIGLIVNSSTMYVCLHILSMHEIFSLVTATVITMLWNFTMTKVFVF